MAAASSGSTPIRNTPIRKQPQAVSPRWKLVTGIQAQIKADMDYLKSYLHPDKNNLGKSRAELVTKRLEEISVHQQRIFEEFEDMCEELAYFRKLDAKIGTITEAIVHLESRQEGAPLTTTNYDDSAVAQLVSAECRAILREQQEVFSEALIKLEENMLQKMKKMMDQKQPEEPLPRRRTLKIRPEAVEGTDATTCDSAAEGTDGENWTLHRNKRTKKPASYSAIAKKTAKSELKNTKKSTAVFISNPDLSPNSTRKAMKDNIKPADMGIGVTSVRLAGSKGIVVNTRSEEDRDKLMRMPTLNTEGFKVELPKTKLPKIQIFGVDRGMAKSEVAEAIWNQNLTSVVTQEEFNKNFDLVFNRGIRERETVIWVAEISPALRDILLSKKQIFIMWDVCRVADYLAVTRCFKCQAYGHPAKYCKVADVCDHCAGDHQGDACPNKSSPVKCANCHRAGKPSAHSVKDPNCPAYKWAIRRL
ncbi:unnamed protein product, partial [Nesidiocoris tenuis]